MVTGDYINTVDYKQLIARFNGCKNVSYKGYEISYNFYGREEYTVFFEGDDVWFKTLDEAKAFIDKMEV